MRVLDLFCGAGGAGMGYRDAGFDVVGVDIKHRRCGYPAGEFIQADALDLMGDLDFLRSFDLIHASPPCQAHTTMSNRYRGAGGKADSHTDLIPVTLAALRSAGVEYVVENVPGARAGMPGGLTLSGGMFGLRVERPRLFTCSRAIPAPPYVRATDPIGVYGRAHDGRRLWTSTDGSELRAARTLAEARAAMGISWMDWESLREAIPPAYTEYIARAFIAHEVLW